MEQLYSDWQCVEAEEKVIHSVKSTRKEVLWVNYEIGENVECQTKTRRRQQASLI